MRIRPWLLAACALPALPQTPPPAIPLVDAVVNGGSFRPLLSPGGLTAIFGQNLGPMNFNPGGPPGLRVTAGGLACFILFSSPNQLNVQLPVELPVGPTTLIVDNQGSRSLPAPIRIDPIAPGLFTLSQTGTEGGPGFFLRSDGSRVTQANPANPGETISVIGVGFGPTNPVIPTGQLTPASPVRTVNQPGIRVGGRVSPAILFSGLVPGLIGYYQVTFLVPADLGAGSHLVNVVIGGVTSNGVSLPVAVAGLVVTQSGFTFQAVQGGGQPAAQTFRVLNGTQGTLNFAAVVSTFNGGGWLSTSPPSGALTAANQAAPVDIRVNPAGLAAGDYYGQIRVDAGDVPNSPRFLSIVLNVVGQNVNPGPTVDPTGLIFVGLLNGQTPAAQTVSITNLTARASPVNITAAFEGNRNFFTFSPANGAVNPGQPFPVSIQPAVAGLPAGVYRGSLILQFPQDNTSRVIQVALIVTPSLPTAAGSNADLALVSRAADAACTPARLVPVFLTLGSNFTSTVAWPSALEMRVLDDCGLPLRTGSVQVTFSNGDPPLALIPNLDGRWSATWTPLNPRNEDLRITATASLPDQNITGTTEIGGRAQPNDLVPTVFPKGVVSSASFSATAAPSPGELVTIFGVRMAGGVEIAQSLPLPTILQDTRVSIGGRPAPLVSTTEGQISAILPYDLPSGSTQQLVVRRGNRISVPEPVSIQSAQPAVFTINQTGRGQGHIYVVPAPGEQILADSSRPAREGEFLVIYCTGLGGVDPPAVSGDATPTDVLRRAVSQISLSIGGVAAPLDFAGLTPGATGLYQINTRVPPGVSPGDSVPVVITASDIPSPPVTMAVGKLD